MNNPLATLTDQFLKERTYLKNVTPATLVWYRVAFKSYGASFGDDTAPVPTKAALQEFVVKQREHGLRPVTVNTYIGAMNAFCVWLHVEGHVVERIKLPKLRVERRMLSLLDDTQMRVLIGYKPTSLGQRRVHVAALLALDTGLRVSEPLRRRDCDRSASFTANGAVSNLWKIWRLTQLPGRAGRRAGWSGGYTPGSARLADGHLA